MGTAANNLPPAYRSADAVRAALAAVRAVYDDLDRRPVERACTRLTECCQFRRTGRMPSVTRGEALLALRAFRATGRKDVPPEVDGERGRLTLGAGAAIARLCNLMRAHGLVGAEFLAGIPGTLAKAACWAV